jgi:hypothetical protein
MADRELSTRDLAGASDAPVEPDASLSEREHPVEAGNDDARRDQASDEGRVAVDRVESDSTRRSAGDTTAGAGAGIEQEPQEPLLPLDQSERFTTRWQEIQASFVDHPRESVEQADALVADLMQRLAASFSNERERLEAQWDRGDDVSTEELRVALTRYRSFFDRLLSA